MFIHSFKEQDKNPSGYASKGEGGDRKLEWLLHLSVINLTVRQIR
jgi:hypothetical protein